MLLWKKRKQQSQQCKKLQKTEAQIKQWNSKQNTMR